MLLLHVKQHRVPRRHGHLRRVVPVHARCERLRKAVQRFSAQTPDHEALERLVVVGGRFAVSPADLARQEPVERHAELGWPRVERRGHERDELRGSEHHHAVGHLHERAVLHDERLLGLLDRPYLSIEHTEELRHAVHGALVREERVRASVGHVATSVGVLGDVGEDLAADPVVTLHQGERHIVPGIGCPPDLVRGCKARDPASDDDDMHAARLLRPSRAVPAPRSTVFACQSGWLPTESSGSTAQESASMKR